MVNHFGSSKKKHKVVAVYLSVANLPAHVRSSIDHMSLVLLCVERDIKQFGCSKFFSEMLVDFKDLEGNGMTVGSETVKGALYCTAGDNLGSHGIGGFAENFSHSRYFCRYCEITRSEFDSNDPNMCGPLGDDSQDVRSVKVNSVFNTLESFHVCQPGPPPCQGHDIFEGVLAYDVALLQYFIKKKKWITDSLLNRRIKQFKYKGFDALTKRCQL